MTFSERPGEESARSRQRACADNADHPRAGELFDLERLPAFHDPFASNSDLIGHIAETRLVP